MECGNSKETLRPALEKIATHEPRKHNGRSRSFTNWQNAYQEIKAIAERALKEQAQ